MTEHPARKRASRLPAERRLEIFSTVVDLVTAKGYEVTTVDQIAAATGTSKATLYRHWGDKPTLVVQALAALDAIDVATIDTGDFVTDMDRFMEMLADRAEQNVALVLTLAEASRRDPALGDALESAVAPDLSAMRAIVANGVRRGEVTRPDRAERLRELLVGVLFDGAIFGGDSTHLTADHLRAYARTIIIPLLTE